MKQCTLVLEFHYGKPGADRGSVWLFAGDGSAGLESDQPFSELPGWHRLVGPVDYELASDVQRRLTAFLRSSGVEVIDEGVAD